MPRVDKRGGRPKGRKTSPPVIIENPVKFTEADVQAFLDKKAETVHKNSSNFKQTIVDRDYLMGVFSMIFERYDGKVMEEKPIPEYRYTPKQMWDAAVKYVKVTIEHQQPLTITQLAIFLGIRRADLMEKVNKHGFTEEYGFIYDLCEFIESYNEYAAHRKQNPAGPIFILKNFGWKDKMEIEATSTHGALSDKEREDAQRRLSNFSE